MVKTIGFYFSKLLICLSALLIVFPSDSTIAEKKTGTSQSAHNTGEKLVAKVDGEDIFMEEILQMAKQLPSQYQKMALEVVYPSLLSRAIDARLVRNAGMKNGFSTDPEVQRRLSEIKGQIISEVFLKKTISSQITDDALRSLYNRSKSEMGGEEQVKARHILLNTEDKAIELIGVLKNGAEFSEIASKHSTGPSAASGGDLGWFGKGQMVPAFSKAAFSLKPGEIVDQPVKTQFGWHIILVEDRKSAEPPSFEEARGQIASQMSQSLLKKLLKNLRIKADIKRYNLNGELVKD